MKTYKRPGRRDAGHDETMGISQFRDCATEVNGDVRLMGGRFRHLEASGERRWVARVWDRVIPEMDDCRVAEKLQ